MGPLPLEEVVDIALPILAAVAAAHDEGVVHRDLKPQNIFLAQMRDGTIQPKVLDFGISKAPAHSPIRTSGAILGSPSYFAPEQVHDPKAISPASDQYALGVILYECVTGRLPYEGSNLAAIFQGIVTGNYRPPRAHRPDLPDDFQRVISRAMSLAPADRFPDLRQMGRALLEFASPRTRLLWRDHFSEAATTGPRPTESPSPVPVTDQTPGPERLPLSSTAFMAGAAAARRDGRAGAAGRLDPARSVAVAIIVGSAARGPTAISSRALGARRRRAGRGGGADRRARVARPPANAAGDRAARVDRRQPRPRSARRRTSRSPNRSTSSGRRRAPVRCVRRAPRIARGSDRTSHH